MKDIIIIDAETTGVDPASDEVLSITLIKARFDGIAIEQIDELTRFYYAETENKGLHINGLTPEKITENRDSAGYPEKFTDRENLRQLADFVGDIAAFSAHNVEFDIGFFKPVFDYTPFDYTDVSLLCTMLTNMDIVQVEWKEKYSGWKWPKLGEVKEYYKIDQHGNFHKSQFDALLVLRILQEMLKRNESGDLLLFLHA